MAIPLQKGRLGPRARLADRRDARRREPRLPAHGEQRLLSIDQLHPSGFNPRKAFDEAELAELADSIRSKGLLQPIIARPDPRARRLRDRRRRAPLARGAEGRACTPCR